MAHPRYSKAEIIERYYWTNNLRLFLGSIFFFALIVLNIFSVRIAENTLLLMLIGLFAFFYSILIFYYLRTQKIALSEIIFLSTFIGILEIALMTLFIYFSGGHMSYHFLLYFLYVALVPFWTPFFDYAPMVWAGFCSFAYMLMLFMTVIGAVPLVNYNQGLGPIDASVVKRSAAYGFFVPVMLVGFAFVEFVISRYLKKERAGLEGEIDEGKERQKQLAAFSEVAWILTHVHQREKMLRDALAKMLEVLKLKSGIILLADPKKPCISVARINIGEEVCAALRSKRFNEIEEMFGSVKGIFLGKDYIQKEYVRKLAFNGKTIGYFLLFSGGEKDKVTPELDQMLSAVADEMAAAVYYAGMLKQLKDVE